SCAIRDCGENAYCEKEQELAICHCNWGYAMTDSGCADTCILKGCNSFTEDCRKYDDGSAYCVCKPGYRNVNGYCVGPATCGSCPTGATCNIVSSTVKAPYCSCPSGYGMSSTACARGYAPTVSSASFTFYRYPKYTLTPYTYTMRVLYNGCTNLPSAVGVYMKSYWRVDRAPGGAGHCRIIYAYTYANCNGPMAAVFNYLSLSSIAAYGVT
ncbi:unnamed protein product, partial [Closterium sp. Naga37s-1]